MSYYISPRFLDKVAIHITKNFLDLPRVRVPLILGIHGRKGEGKSFQCELVFEKLGVEVVHMSAGELESPDAGDPSRLLRLRYREAAEMIRTHGRMCALMINDLDAGAGRLDQGTQYTVNTQLVNGTLMNIADNPTNVQLPGSYDDKPLHRVPIIVTGNDFATLYAPLIRDGRMEKFYWEPDRDDRIGVVQGIFEADGVQRRDVEKLVDTFPNQSLDFYGALRSRLYDEQIRDFIHKIGYERVSMRVVNSNEKPPEFRKPDFSLPHLIEIGNLMVQEQQRVQSMGLSREYNEALRSHVSSVPDAGSSSRRESASQSDRGTPHTASRPSETTNGSNRSESSHGSPSRNGKDSRQETKLAPEVLEQIRQLLAQGFRVGMEHVNQRRFRTGSWQSCGFLQGEQESEAIAALEACLAEHSDEYVRLVGIDPKVKRRVVETIIHRPASKAAHY